MDRTMQRPLAWGVMLALTLSLTVLSPRPALAHDSCAIAQPAATGVLGVFVAAINVFEPVMPTANDCPDKFGDTVPKLTRDWQTPQISDDERFGLAAFGDADRARTYAACDAGEAADFFECDNIDLLSHVSHAELGTEFLNDIWGWTDPEDGSDYALVGARNGTVFVDITDALQPQVLGIMESASFLGGENWRDVKVYENHAYVVSEHTDHGVQVFDLTRLRDHSGTYTEYEADARYLGHGSAHNIAINEDTGFAYSVGAGPTTEQVPFRVAAGDRTYLANGAGFGPSVDDGLTADLAAVEAAEDQDFPDADPFFGCGELIDFPEGAIAVAERGACPFERKAVNAQEAGAVGLIVINDAPGTVSMPGDGSGATIPAVMISDSDGALLLDELPTEATIDPNPAAAPCGTGLHMIDINEPKNPTFAGCFDDHDYIHDTQCVIYDGPDTRYTGREICFNSNGISYTADPEFNYVSIVDVTDKENPVALSRLGYEGSAYSHQGWLTEDQAYFLHGDEGDEQINGVDTTTRVWDVTDLRAPEVIEVFENDTTSIDHNIYTKDGFAYAANYTSGLRIYDARDVAEDGLSEVGFFDMYPENQDATFEGGPWSSYPYFAQDDVVAVSSIDRGLFLLRPQLPQDEDEADERPACDRVAPIGFPDIPAGPPHGDSVGCLAGYGVVEGKRDGTFGPADPVRRDQVASFVARSLEVAGVELPAQPTSSWPDVTTGPHRRSIEQLTDLGIIRGRSGGGYDPGGEMTRAQIAAVVVRALELVGGEELSAPRSPFTDVPAGFVHAGDIDVAFDLGIVLGRTSTTYDPQNDVRRDQMASMLARTLQHLAEQGAELTPRG